MSDPNLDAARHVVPRHLRIALANAARAFTKREPASLATINENVQPVVDAAMGWITVITRERDEARQIVNACMGAVPVTTVAFAGDVPLYIRTALAAVDTLTALINDVIDRKPIPFDAPEIIHTLQRHHEMVNKVAGDNGGTLEDVCKALGFDSLESDDLVADARTARANIQEAGRRRGMEEAAKVCDARAASFNDPTHCQMCAIDIRAKATRDPRRG